MAAQLQRERIKAARRHDLHNLNRLKTQAGIAGFLRQQRLKAYAVMQRKHNAVGPVATRDSLFVHVAEIQTQTDELSEWSKSMLARDEQSLEHLAEADLAYLEMVRTKAGLHHQTAGKACAFSPHFHLAAMRLFSQTVCRCLHHCVCESCLKRGRCLHCEGMRFVDPYDVGVLVLLIG